MDFVHFKAGKDDDGRRLDRIIRNFLDEKSLSLLYKSLRKGLIKLNGKKCRGDEKVQKDDDIQIAGFLAKSNSEPADKKNGSLPKNSKNCAPLNDKIIIFRNEDLLILNKPYDLPVQGGNKNASLAEMVQGDYEFYHQKKESLSFKCGPLHRLDRKTSGIIVFSQSLKGAKWFSAAIKNHTARKIYLGICQGNLKENENWNDEITNSAENEKFKTVKVNNSAAAPEKNTKNAVTHAFPLAHGKFGQTEVTLVKYEIETGRKHQIRAQSAFHGFPLIGDTAYGGQKIDSSKYGRDFFLHAAELDFPSGKEMESLPEKITCPLQDDFRNFLSFSLINENGALKYE